MFKNPQQRTTDIFQHFESFNFFFFFEFLWISFVLWNFTKIFLNLWEGKKQKRYRLMECVKKIKDVRTKTSRLGIWNWLAFFFSTVPKLHDETTIKASIYCIFTFTRDTINILNQYEIRTMNFTEKYLIV